MKTKILAIATIGLSFSLYATYGHTKAKGTWMEKAHCRAPSTYSTPNMILKSNLYLIGVNIGPNGEIVRMHPKDHVTNNLPNHFYPEDHSNLFDDLTADDFEKYDGEWGDWVRTPLDFNRPDEVAVAYVLIPKTWSYSDPAMSMKTKAKPWRHPQIQLPKKAVSEKVAILYRAERNYRSKQNCRYEFNLHVTISQKENGKTLSIKSENILIPPSSIFWIMLNYYVKSLKSGINCTI